MIRFYARVSTKGQNLTRQLSAFEELKEDFTNIKSFNKESKIYRDKKSGRNADRPALKQMLADLQEGDIVYTKSIDRLARSTVDLDKIVNQIKAKKATLKIINLPTTDVMDKDGKMLVKLLAVLAEWEVEGIDERRDEGIKKAKEVDAERLSNGLPRLKYKGRKEGTISLIGADEIKEFINLYNSNISISALARIYKKDNRTIHKWAKTIAENELYKEFRNKIKIRGINKHTPYSKNPK